MALEPSLRHFRWTSGPHTWNRDRAALYALAVGAGPAEIDFALGDVVLPTFPTTLVDLSAQPSFGSFDPSMLLHTRQSISIRRPIPVSGTVMASSRVAGVWDIGTGAVVDVETTCLSDEVIVASLTSSLTIRREGGFSGERPPTRQWAAPSVEPDYVVRYQTGEAQALLYRLTGDCNPIHWNASVAKELGLRKPLAHGLCSFGYAGRALIETICDGDVNLFRDMSVRFVAPVYPGDALAVHIWERQECALFQVWTERGKVLDEGIFAAAHERW